MTRTAAQISGSSRHDVIVAGGGPAGATTALALARSGVDVLVVERTRFPRFHVGESLLPRNLRLLRELGLTERLERVPHTPKSGAEFAFGHGTDSLTFEFGDGLLAGAETHTYNVERASFDHALLEAAAEAGATVWQGTSVSAIRRLEEGAVEVEIGGAGPGSGGDGHRRRHAAARLLVDATGQSTLLGKHLGLRREWPGHRKVACFGHFRGVERLPGDAAGHPCIVMMADAWFWLIAVDAERTSIGVVMDRAAARRVQEEHGLHPRQLLRWAVARCPFVARRTAGATFPEETHVAADFSYRCAPYAGPGHYLVGDAATFLDPIFSTGICLGMVGGRQVAEHVRATLDGADPARERAAYRRFVEESSAPLFRLVQLYYQHPFRELMMSGTGPLGVHRALFSLLAGHVFPRPPWALRWRLRLVELFTRLQRRFPVVERHERRFLLAAEAREEPRGPGPAESPAGRAAVRSSAAGPAGRHSRQGPFGTDGAQAEPTAAPGARVSRASDCSADGSGGEAG